MTTLKVISVFLASPSDLDEERKLANEAVEELNKGIAPQLGFRVELKGWEDTLSGYGRPQEIINKELDLCDIFIGMMWKKWGTSTSKCRKYTSGFEEEYTRFKDKLKRDKNCEMSIYFKKIEEELLRDPGQDLKKVLAFKDKIIDEKGLLFQQFEKPIDIQRLIRLKIQNFLFTQQKLELEKKEEQNLQAKNINSKSTPENKSKNSNTPKTEGHNLLKNILKKTISTEEDIKVTQLEVARLRLLANTLADNGNDDIVIGAHDSNIIFTNREEAAFGNIELSKLIDAGLNSIEDANIPLWYWYKVYTKNINKDCLHFKTFNKEQIARGALEAMKLINLPFPQDRKNIDRKFYINLWLSEQSQNQIKTAALKYLRYIGQFEDLELIQNEIDKSNSNTSRFALEAKIEILMKYDKTAALETIFTYPFEHFDKNLLNRVLELKIQVEINILEQGLSHRNSTVRLESLNRLFSKNKLSPESIQKLLKDTNAAIRKRAVELQIKEGKNLDNDEIKKILIKPRKDKGFSGFFGTASDDEGRECYRDFIYHRLLELPQKELEKKIDDYWIYDELPYFALCDKYFNVKGNELRAKIDDGFKNHFEDFIKYLKELGVSEDSVSDTYNIENYVRKGLTRQALDILCRKGAVEDLNRIRKHISSDFIDSSYEELNYLQKHGEWKDIPNLIEIKKDFTVRDLLFSNEHSNWNNLAAKTILSIAKEDVERIFKYELPKEILREIIIELSPQKLASLTKPVQMKMLNSEDPNIRKFACLKLIKILKKSELENFLAEYTKQDYRYYNVIHWLDFGIVMPKKTINYTTSLIFKELN